nr:MAG TPA: hypothetical protein [Caudoviricetes sp.]
MSFASKSPLSLCIFILTFILEVFNKILKNLKKRYKTY